MLTVRCSSLPLAFLCPASAHGDLSIDTTSEPADVGTAVHECLALMVKGLPYDPDAVAAKYNVPAGEVAILVATGAKMWREKYASVFPRPVVEGHLIGYVDDNDTSIGGHPDVWDKTDRVITVLDWKTGRKDGNPHHNQGMGYLSMLYDTFGAAYSYTYAFAFLRDATHDVREFSWEQVCEWRQEFVQKVVLWDGTTYRTGDHCAHCKRFASCEAAQRTFAATALALLGESLPMDPAGLIALHGQIGVVEAACKRAKSLIHAAVEQAGGRVEAGGKALVLKDAGRDTIDVRKAWLLLTDNLTEDELARCLDVRKGALLDAVGAKAPRGRGKATKKLFMEALEAAGAVTRSAYKTLTIEGGKDNDAGQE